MMVTVRNARKPWRSRRAKTSRASADEGGVEGIGLERFLLSDGLRLPLIRHGTVGDAPRLGMGILTQAAEPVDEQEQLDVTQIADSANPPVVEHALRLRTDAGDDGDGQRIEKLLNLRGLD